MVIVVLVAFDIINGYKPNKATNNKQGTISLQIGS
jgi:hypothetical protein